MSSLVDIHCHILPGVDDGALDLRDSIAMARVAARDGITAVCATPHIRADHDVRIAELAARVDALNDELTQAGIGVQVLPGGEVAEPIVGTLTDAELSACALGGGGRWILVEPAAGALGERTIATVDELAKRGFGTVLAHPERHPGERVGDALRAIAERGALIQLTAAFVLDGSADWFMRERLVHIVASDAHSSHGGRPLEIAAAQSALCAALPEHAAWLTALPAAVAAGEMLTPP